MIKLPLGWSIIFFKNRLYDLGSMPELGATGSLGVICMYGIICRRAVLEGGLGISFLTMVYPRAVNCSIGRVSPVEGC